LRSGNGKARNGGGGDAPAEERTFKDRLIDQVNSGGSLGGGSTDEKERGDKSEREEGAASR
jgi:hypothetical protein